MVTKSERLIERARREFRYGKSNELHVVKQVIRAGAAGSERGDLFRQVNRLLEKDRGSKNTERHPALVP